VNVVMRFRVSQNAGKFIELVCDQAGVTGYTQRSLSETQILNESFIIKKYVRLLASNRLYSMEVVWFSLASFSWV